MNKEQISVKIKEILTSTFMIPEDQISAKTSTPLLLEPFNLDAVSLTYLYLIVFNCFRVAFPSDFFNDYQNNTIDGIAEQVSKLG